MEKTPKAVLTVLLGIMVWAVLGAAPVQAGESEEKTTVLGLYVEWQTNGMPKGIEEVSFDEDSSRLIVVLEADQQEMEEQILSRINDPENIEIRFALEKEPEPAPEGVNVKGALVLGGGYLAAMAVFLAYLVIHLKISSKSHTDGKTETADNNDVSEE